ncbi:hypothetical protein mRhiFer1_007955 [Rhinolophus ferrumequinum]|uniref:Uncharacterized protein n=1 Tax=Rhinolophus ferrumequinum TaxID=59479 RepID=A0A7J8AVT9_RHIFE|nr:hypothetical protein mRhiFer1_007955 [Rhinolophus ferrumequinum]
MQSWGQVDVHSSRIAQDLEQDGWPVLPEYAMDKHQGQGLWGLHRHQLQLTFLQGVSLRGLDERASAGVPLLQGKLLLSIGVHHTLHIFSRESADLGSSRRAPRSMKLLAPWEALASGPVVQGGGQSLGQLHILIKFLGSVSLSTPGHRCFLPPSFRGAHGPDRLPLSAS